MDTIAKIASSVALPFLRQFTYILLYNSYLTELESEILKLQRDEKEVRHTVEASKRSGEEIEDTVKDWFSRVHAALEEAQKFLNGEDKERVGCLDLYSKYMLSQKARNLVDLLCALRKETFDRVSYRCALKCNVSPAARGYEDLESRTKVMVEIMEALKDVKVHMVGVYGIGGVGKTAVVKELAWQAEKDGSFDVVVMANVTNNSDVKMIRDEIADALGLKFDEQTELGRASRLRQRIRQEQKILVVLDDVWGKLDLTEVGVPFGEDHEGCKLLVTSRDHNVLNAKLGAEKVYRIEGLSEDESWSLFEKKGGEAVKDLSIQPLAIKLAKSCSGLPLLIVTVIEALKNNDLYAWKDALEQLINFDFEGSYYSQVLSAIKLSYDCLESHELKSFFLLLGSMGNGYNMKDFLTYGWCLGLHKHVDTLADGRNRLHKLIDNLRDACLLLEGGRESVVALDLVRAVAASIASEVKPFFTMQRNSELKEWPRLDLLKNCHHIFLDWCYIHELPEKLECPNLKILQLNSQGNYLKVPDDFFLEMKELKVLSLGGLNCSPSLPPSLALLTNLQALNLCKCILEDIATIGELTSLEILNLEKSELKELPAEIGQLIHLRLLDLSDCPTLEVIPCNLISSLTSLEELYMGNCNIHWEIEGSENRSNNSSLSELKHLHQLTTLNMQVKDASVFPRDLLTFWKLESYKILIGDRWKWSEVESGNYKTSRVLKLNLNMDPSILLDYGIKLLMTRAEDLYLAGLKGVGEVLYELNDEGFPRLKHLNIQDSAEMQCIIGSTKWAHNDHAFPNLESLILHNLINMERICSGPLPAQAFTKLQVIKVKGCDRMEFVFLHSIVKHLSELLEIEISECKFMTKIIAEKEQEDDGETDKIEFSKTRSLILECLPSLVNLSLDPRVKATENDNGFSSELLNDRVEFPNLETLKLYSINVQKIWDEKLSAGSCFQNMTTLTVDGCERLTYLFSYSVAGKLDKLQHLLISSCKLVENIFVQDESMGHLSLARKLIHHEEVPIFPNLETFVISHMDNLKSIWPNQLTQNSFCKLKKMEITSCDNLLNVFPCHVLNKLQSLESLDVWFCNALEVVYEIEGTSQEELHIPLRTLSLGHLPKLKYMWNKDPEGSVRFQNLIMVKATKCESLKHIFPLSVAKDLQQLQVIEISDCGVLEIIAKDQGGDESAIGLVFPELASLKFVNLPELQCFCTGNHNFRFPFLNKLYMVECPAMETFCEGILRASILRKIYLTQKGDQWHWEGDLNTTVRKIFNRDFKGKLSIS
ncbi:PREDICTED: disease resistance protein RPS2-like [Lupinus angustifolius]|uniref:disease resistance protein RPS2-like n=1 Tax=Lupinus angustifolius TaxID=3871 RepID=UPI00092EAC88|nr:PREDICTED: disease resistance protein RPS2-like [Lupinus angustifolius]